MAEWEKAFSIVYFVAAKTLIHLMLKQVKIFVSAARSDVALVRKGGRLHNRDNIKSSPYRKASADVDKILIAT